MEFTSVQLGLDVATSLAILASAVTFVYNQKRKNDQMRIQQLDKSVRNVATEQLQGAIHTLSRKFINEVADALNMPSNVLEHSLEKAESDFTRRKNLPAKLLDQFGNANDAILSFIKEVHAYKYQIFPLLDTLGNGQREITEFKKQLDALVNLFNTLSRSGTPLAKELELVLEFCADNPSASLDDENKMRELFRLSHSLMGDEDYAHWVNSFIPDEDIAAYWDSDAPNYKEVRLNAVQNFIGHAYEHPHRLRAQVFTQVFLRYREGSTMCKKFLIMLAAINHTLLCTEGTAAATESPSDTTRRYASNDYFALDSEVR